MNPIYLLLKLNLQRDYVSNLLFNIVIEEKLWNDRTDGVQRKGHIWIHEKIIKYVKIRASWILAENRLELVERLERLSLLGKEV